ncbi:unnamed protein product [Candidula unifasciata]|uniref:Uncharacterized protein n=1 Tax=Candidula unifasciata TaxID=100452 RepID=A0A8S3Z4P3_9EUPU|nr:unnamed protein product [Candidula unifasciata]
MRLALDSYDDLKTAPPLYDHPDPATIQVLLYVTSIDAVNEASMDFTVGILLHLRWVDKRIYHDKAKLYFENNRVESLDFDSENIKKKKGSFHDIMTHNQMMRLYKEGTILYISRLSMTLSCPMDLMNYPFDKQTCYLLIMSFGYSDADLILEWMNTTEPFSDVLDGQPIVVDESIVLPQFEVKDVKANTCNKRYHQKYGNHSCLQAEFHMSRNIWFYMVQMYVPSILIVMLSWISFWLTVNSVPGRISLGLLTVLTMTTQSSSVNAALPRVSYTKAIDVWMSTCLVFVFAALLEFAIVNVLSRKDSIRGFSFRHIFSVSKDYEGGDTPATEMTLPLDGYPEEVQKKRRFAKKGIVYATYLDIVSRIFFPVCFGIFMLTYWLYYVYRD